MNTFPIVLPSDRDSSGNIVSYIDYASKGAGNAQGNLQTSALAEYQGRFLNEDGFLSVTSKRLQDNNFYQDFSYVIKSSVPVDKWKEVIKRIIHPAGMLLFGEVQFITSINDSVSMQDTTRSLISNRTINNAETITASVVVS